MAPPDERPVRPVEPELLTVAEVAGRLRVSRMTIYRMVERNELHGVRVGRVVRISSASLRTFLGL